MRDVRIARLRFLTDRGLRSAIGGALLAAYWMGGLAFLAPLVANWRSWLLLLALGTVSFYADAARVPERRGFKQLQTAAYDVSKRVTFFSFAYWVVTEIEWKRLAEMMVDGPDLKRAFTTFGVYMLLSGLVAVVSMPITVPVLALLDRWQVRQEDGEMVAA